MKMPKCICKFFVGIFTVTNFITPHLLARRVQQPGAFLHSFYIPHREGVFYDLEPAGPAQIKPLIPGEKISSELLDKEEIQVIVTPVIYAALLAWAKAGSGQALDKTQRKDVKVLADGIAVYAALNALMEVAKRCNVVFITESSEGKKDKSIFIPEGTIITGEGYISPEQCQEILGDLPSTVEDVLEVLNCLEEEHPQYVVAINYDPVENTNAHVDGKKGSFSIIGATFYPVAAPEEISATADAKIHYIPDEGFYLAGYSWYSPEVKGEKVDVSAAPADVLKIIFEEGEEVNVGFLDRGRHGGIRENIPTSGINARMLIPKDGDAILRVLAVSGKVPGISPLLVCGASGTSEAAIAYKTAMMFKAGHTILTYVPSSVNDGDLLEFLQMKKGMEKFESIEVEELKKRGITPTHYLGQFDSDRAYLPPGAFNVVAFVPITGADPQYVGEYVAQLLPGIQTSVGVTIPAEARGIFVPSRLEVQALVAVKFPEDEDGKIFVLQVPFKTANIGNFVGFVDNALFPLIAKMVVDEESRRNVIPPITPEK